MRAFRKKVSIYLCTTIILTFVFLFLYFCQDNAKMSYYFWTLSLTSFCLVFIGLPIIIILERITLGKKPDLSFFKGLALSLILFGGIGFLFSFFYLKNLLADIPYAVTSNYSQVEGVCYEAHGAGRGTFSFTVKDIKFTVGEGAKKFVINGVTYNVVFLPNSKTVIEINPIKKPMNNGIEKLLP